MRLPHPRLVLAVALLLPGCGHVISGFPRRGLMFAFFTLLFAMLTWRLSGPDISFVGRAAGGLFVWALSIPDAYRIARLRWERARAGLSPDGSRAAG